MFEKSQNTLKIKGEGR